jgi:hypothetical protein
MQDPFTFTINSEGRGAELMPMIDPTPASQDLAA